MYTYLQTEVKHLIPFAWFIAEGRSIYEVALLLQKGLINREFIRTSKGSSIIRVAYTNFDDWTMIEGDKYHVHPVLAETKGYVRIGITLEPGEYVASWFRPELNEEILPSTWKSLFDNETAPLPCTAEEDEYADYEEPDNLDDPVKEAELYSYDLDYDDDPLLYDESFDEYDDDEDDYVEHIEHIEPVESVELAVLTESVSHVEA